MGSSWKHWEGDDEDGQEPGPGVGMGSGGRETRPQSCCNRGQGAVRQAGLGLSSLVTSE